MMEVNANTTVGSLQISTDVLCKIARQATMEIEGVAAVAPSSNSVRSAVASRIQKSVTVSLQDGVAQFRLNLVVRYGTKIPQLCERVQEAVKSTVQSMTGVTVSHVHITVVGLCGQE